MSATTEEPDQTAQPANEDSEQMRQEQATDAAEAEGDGDATPAATSKPSLCGVCNVNPPKYKCPRCYLPYCSVACHRTHRENHPPDPEPRPQIEQPQSQPPSDTQKLSEPLPSDSSNSFHALETSDKLRLLFQKYPNLPDQLLKIHAATLPPPETKSVIPASLLKGLPPKKETWNHDIGIQNGKEALRKARRADGEDGDAIREYSELILHLMNAGGAEADVGNLLRQQLAQEDTKLIERLMAQEKR